MDRTYPTVAQNVAFFVALLATAFAFGAALAHALELPNKIGMTRDDYFTVQRIYTGWSQIAYVLAVELVALLVLIALYWHVAGVRWAVSIALAGLISAQILFWVYTFPANQVTRNWTVPTENWEALRTHWEYSHLAGAACQLLALVALTVAVLRR